MMGRLNEVPLSQYSDIIMETVHDNNRQHCVEFQEIGQAKTSPFQELCIYPEREYRLYEWYRSMAYLCVL